jgi:hypothetical protein
MDGIMPSPCSQNSREERGKTEGKAEGRQSGKEVLKRLFSLSLPSVFPVSSLVLP